MVNSDHCGCNVAKTKTVVYAAPFDIVTITAAVGIRVIVRGSGVIVSLPVSNDVTDITRFGTKTNDAKTMDATAASRTAKKSSLISSNV